MIDASARSHQSVPVGTSPAETSRHRRVIVFSNDLMKSIYQALTSSADFNPEGIGPPTTNAFVNAYSCCRSTGDVRKLAKSCLACRLAPSSRLQNLRHIAGDGLLQFAGLGVQGFEFLVQRFELFLEVLVADILARRNSHVAARIERPALRFDFA